MARYIATQPIYFGGALAFPAGHQVPADHVERFGYDKAGWVVEVDDDHRGDALDLVPAATDTTPPDLREVRFVDQAAVAVEQAQRAHALGDPAVQTLGDEAAADAADTEPEPGEQPTSAPKPKSSKPKPATGDTTTATVTEA